MPDLGGRFWSVTCGGGCSSIHASLSFCGGACDVGRLRRPPRRPQGALSRGFILSYVSTPCLVPRPFVFRRLTASGAKGGGLAGELGRGLRVQHPRCRRGRRGFGRRGSCKQSRRNGKRARVAFSSTFPSRHRHRHLCAVADRGVRFYVPGESVDVLRCLFAEARSVDRLANVIVGVVCLVGMRKEAGEIENPFSTPGRHDRPCLYNPSCSPVGYSGDLCFCSGSRADTATPT